MRELSEIKNSSMIHDVVWTYNLCSNGVSESTQEEAEKILFCLIGKIEEQSDISENQMKAYFSEATTLLENLFSSCPLDKGGIYEYGGLNDFFAKIMEAFGFEVKRGKFNYISDFVYGGELGNEK